MAKEKHSPTGASNCERWANCLGSTHFIEQSGVKFTGNQYTAEGSVAHKVAEKKLKHILYGEMFDGVIGSTYKQDGYKITVTQEMMDAVDVYVKDVLEMKDEYGLSLEDFWLEKKISIDVNGDKTKLYGTADYVAHVPFECIIAVDYKHGAGTPVDANDNFQLMYYLVGVLDGLPESDRQELRYGVGKIVQPRSFGGGIKAVHIPIDEIQRFKTYLIERLALVKPGAPLTAGKWCKFCPVKDRCPEILKQSTALAGVDFANVDLKEKVTPALAATQIPDEQAFRIYENTKMITEFLEAIGKRVYEKVEQNPGMDFGFYLEQKLGNTQWVESIDVEIDGAESFYKEVIKSPAEMKKEFKDDAEMLKFIDQLTYRPLGKKVLVKGANPLADIDVEGI